MNANTKVFVGALFGAIAGVVISGILMCSVGFYVYKKEIAPFFAADEMEEGPIRTLEPPEFDKKSPVAAYDWKIVDLKGEETSFSSFKNEVIFLNLWATWCPPCVSEMPTIQRLFEKVGDKVRIVCVSQEDPGMVEKFAEAKKYGFPIYTLRGELPQAYKADSIPASFIINRKGEIVFSEVGSADWGHETAVDYFKSLL
ncbi:MAG: TlpA disulfide reductase family protein [Thermodesulfobacteriota bacterium]|nr:TlpA disulfide reductase family protein [Thermodesulfobacteriota bacterium]